MNLSFLEYQKQSKTTAIYPNVGNNVIYTVIGLAGETGEVADKVKKVLRDKDGKFDTDAIESIKMELGDVLWYIAQIASELGLNMDDIATSNLNKLLARQIRNQLHGSGDKR